MDEFIKTALRHLRSERCPERVLDEVKRRIAAQRTPVFRIRTYLIPSAVAVVLIMSATLLYLRLNPAIDRPYAPMAQGTSETDRTGREVYASLTCIALVLNEAGSRGGTIIFQETLPLLRRGLETTKNAITTEIRP